MGNCPSKIPAPQKPPKPLSNPPRRLPPHGAKHHRPIAPAFPFQRGDPSKRRSIREREKPVVEAYWKCVEAYNNYARANRVAFEYARVLQKGNDADTSRYVKEFVRADRQRGRLYDNYTRAYDEYIRVYWEYDGSQRAKDENKRVAEQYKIAREELARLRGKHRRMYHECVRLGGECDRVAATSARAIKECHELARTTADRRQRLRAREEARRFREQHARMLEQWKTARDKCVRVGKRSNQKADECEQLYYEYKRVYDAYTWTRNEYSRYHGAGKHKGTTYEHARKFDRTMRSYDDYIRLWNSFIKSSPDGLRVE